MSLDLPEVLRSLPELHEGEGERLRPLTATIPKALVEVQGRSLLERHLGAGGACVLATHGAHRPPWAGTVDYHLVSGAAA